MGSTEGIVLAESLKKMKNDLYRETEGRGGSALLETKELTMEFGGLKALDRVNLRIEEGSIKGLIGPNGSGKTTLFNVISGFYVPTRGKIFFDGAEITGRNPHLIARRGIGRTFQGTKLYDKRTLRDNILVALHACRRNKGVQSGFSGKGTSDLEAAEEILDFVGLSEYKDEVVKNIPFGTRHLLEIGRVLATGPRLILLDEPSTGLNQVEVTQELKLIREIRDRGITVFIVEHNMKVIMDICDSISVLDMGVMIADDVPAAIRRNLKVIESYLGREA